MKLHFGSFAVVLAILTQFAWAQSGQGDLPQSGSPGSSQQQGSSGPQPVFTNPEERPPLALLDEVTAHSFINLGMGVAAAYDTNVATFANQGYSRTVFIFSPSIQLKQTRPKLTWNVNANGGLTTSSSKYSYNSANPSASASILYQISRHWQASAQYSYFYSADPFTQYLTYTSPPTYNQPNPTIYVPLGTTESGNGVLNLSYQINSHDILSFTGTQSFRRFLHTSYTAYNTYSWGGGPAYQHAFSPKLAAGVAYFFNSLDFGHGVSRSGIQQFTVFGSYQLSPHMSVTGWVGPELTNTKNIVPVLCTPYGCFYEVFHLSSWSTAFGGSFSWSGARNAFTAGVQKSVSDGGILLGIVQLYQVTSSYTRQLNPRWNLNLGLLYGDNQGYSTRFHAQHLSSFTSNVGFTRQFTPAFSATLQYILFYQSQQNVLYAEAPTWTNNHLQFTLQYNWGHSLGR